MEEKQLTHTTKDKHLKGSFCPDTKQRTKFYHSEPSKLCSGPINIRLGRYILGAVHSGNKAILLKTVTKVKPDRPRVIYFNKKMLPIAKHLQVHAVT